jgi:hypothetical protein
VSRADRYEFQRESTPIESSVYGKSPLERILNSKKHGGKQGTKLRRNEISLKQILQRNSKK